MATLGTTALTLADWAKRVTSEENGKIADIVEMLNATNEILDDMKWVESNQATSHRTTMRTGLPAVAWRLLNYGVAAGKSRTVQVEDSLGMLEAYSKVDKELADLNGNTAEFRLSEDRPFIEAMNQEMASTLFYGNTATDREKFLGLTARYSSLQTSVAETAENVITAGGSGNANTSVWLVVWGENTIHGLFPKGQYAGLKHEDLGEDTLSDGNGGEYQGYRAHYIWKAGLTVRDWRYAVRIPNVKTADLTKNAASGADLIDLMTQALERVNNLNMGTPVFYCNRDVRSVLRRQIANKVASSTLTMDTVAGKRVLAFDNVPVRRTDALLNTESDVS